MAQRVIEQACQRFQKSISSEDDRDICSVSSVDEVRQAIVQIQAQLAARQSLRNLRRLSPFLDAAERYSKTVDPLMNSTLPTRYIWAPVKFVIQSVNEHTQALDKILSAYAEIGSVLPRFSRLGGAFQEDGDFQRLLAYLYEDIMEFHQRAYKLLRRPDSLTKHLNTTIAWRSFFCSGWGLFEHRFGSLIKSISIASESIDREAATINILNLEEWRRRALEQSVSREQRWESEQRLAVLKWLDSGETEQEERLEQLVSKACEGTGHWINQNERFRTWMGRRRGGSVLWIHGKPGSGKSVLTSRIISNLRKDNGRLVLFFYCDNYSPGYGTLVHILRVYCSQMIRFTADFVPFFYDEYVSKAKHASEAVLREALQRTIPNFDDVRMVVDGIDELPSPQQEHRKLLKDLMQIISNLGSSCKLLIASQDLPTIRPTLSQKPALCLGEESIKASIQEDVETIVDGLLHELNGVFNNALDDRLIKDLRKQIVRKADGMLLWVRLIFSLLESSSSVHELRYNVNALPKDLDKMYDKIVTSIRDRCSPNQFDRVRRTFEWLLFGKPEARIKKCELLLGSSIYHGGERIGRENRPFPTALEICKPLIEDGPHGTIGIIHSTLSQYLLTESSELFISAPLARSRIAYACVSHLVRMLDYVISTAANTELAQFTALGVFGLQGYANEYWIEHLLEVMNDEATDEGDRLLVQTRKALLKQTQRLCTKHAKAVRLDATESASVSKSPAKDHETVGLDPRLHTLETRPELHQLVSQVLRSRLNLQSQQETEGVDFTTLQQDQTLFSKVDASHRRDIHHLLRATSYPGVQQDELQAFKAEYGPGAFPCPMRKCIRSRFGFSSDTQLQDHKARQHGKRLQCYKAGCTYSDVGFSSNKSLLEHQRRYHGTGSGKRALRRVPRFPRKPQSSAEALARPSSSPSHSPTSPLYESHPDFLAPPGPTSPSYSHASPGYTPASPNHIPASPNYTPASPSPKYTSTSPKYTPTSPNYSPGSPYWPPTTPPYYSSRPTGNQDNSPNASLPAPRSIPLRAESPAFSPPSPVFRPASPDTRGVWALFGLNKGSSADNKSFPTTTNANLAEPRGLATDDATDELPPTDAKGGTGYRGSVSTMSPGSGLEPSRRHLVMPAAGAPKDVQDSLDFEDELLALAGPLSGEDSDGSAETVELAGPAKKPRRQPPRQPRRSRSFIEDGDDDTEDGDEQDRTRKGAAEEPEEPFGFRLDDDGIDDYSEDDSERDKSQGGAANELSQPRRLFNVMDIFSDEEESGSAGNRDLGGGPGRSGAVDAEDGEGSGVQGAADRSGHQVEQQHKPSAETKDYSRMSKSERMSLSMKRRWESGAMKEAVARRKEALRRKKSRLDGKDMGP